MSETPTPSAALKALAEIDSATISNAIELSSSVIRSPATHLWNCDVNTPI